MPRFPVALLLCAGALVSSLPSTGSTPAEHGLVRPFENPPATAKPVTWWHWMNGNVTKEGITLDLEWMARIGLGGALVFETSQVPLPGEAVHRSPYWQECVQHAIREAARLGLTLGMHNCSGWNNSGGPWVEPADSMKKLVFSRSVLAGPAAAPKAPPPAPAEKILPFTLLNAMNRSQEKYRKDRTNYIPFYQDVAVFAYPAPEGAGPPLRELGPQLAPAAAGPASALWDGDETTGIDLEKARTPDGKSSEITLRFASPLTARSISLVSGEGGIPCREVELAAGLDNGTFRPVTKFRLPKNGGPLREYQGVSFPPTTASSFRLRFVDWANADQRPVELRELELSGDARLEAWPVKAGFLRGRGEEKKPNPAVTRDPSQAVARDRVVDLTGKLRPDGTLDWQAPEGKWILLRVGTTTTGKMNHPATLGGIGLEVDKLDKAALARFFKEGLMQQVVDLAGPEAGKALDAFGTDSWEVGAQNWTPDMVNQFRQRRGYDPTPWMPALSGQILGSPEESERFLWDWRQTLSDLYAEHFYGGFTAFCHAHGLHSFAEPYNTGNFNNLQMGGFVDDVAPVFWTDGKRFTEGGIREMASIANTHGLPRLEAEAFTSEKDDAMWREHPRRLKSTGDAAFAYGVNRYVFHTSAHQPWTNTVPGMTMGPFGINFTRNTTWAEQAKGWIAYITRCQAMLQSGRYVADALFFVGEGSPNSFAAGREKIGMPEGHGYDGCDAAILLSHASVENGEIVLKSGMRYRFLVLPDQATMSVLVAEKIRDLVKDGAMVLAPTRPDRTPGLAGYPESDARLRSVIAELFGSLDGKTAAERDYGKGKLHTGITPAALLKKLNLPPAWELLTPPAQGTVRAIQRREGRTDFFFVACESSDPVKVEMAFRVADGQPEIWNPGRGTRRLATGVRHEHGRTIVPLSFEPDDAVFVVFPPQPTTTEPDHDLRLNEITSIAGPWQVLFPPQRGAPAAVELPALADLSTRPEEGVKFFSGTATYRSTFRLSEAEMPAGPVFLDLGGVEVIAEVKVNGEDFGVLWKNPYRVDVARALRSGENTVEIRATNLWINRLIGDERQFPQKNPNEWAAQGSWPEWVIDFSRPKPTGRIGFVSWPYWKATDPLPPSGLIGPVRLLAAETVKPPKTKP